MKGLLQIMLISTTLVISGCAEPERYPISGEACKPDDPVKSLSADDCLVPTG
jgi:hypothetical protein